MQPSHRANCMAANLFKLVALMFNSQTLVGPALCSAPQAYQVFKAAPILNPQNVALQFNVALCHTLPQAYQVFKARASGADAILLIAAVLPNRWGRRVAARVPWCMAAFIVRPHGYEGYLGTAGCLGFRQPTKPPVQQPFAFESCFAEPLPPCPACRSNLHYLIKADVYPFSITLATALLT